MCNYDYLLFITVHIIVIIKLYGLIVVFWFVTTFRQFLSLRCYGAKKVLSYFNIMVTNYIYMTMIALCHGLNNADFLC